MPDPDENNVDTKTLLSTLVESQKSIADGLKALQSGNIEGSKAILEELRALRTPVNNSDGDDDDGDDKDDDDDADLETMSRKELAAHLKKQFDKTLAKTNKEWERRLGDVSQRSDANSVRQEVKEAEAEFDDFKEWKKEMGQIARQYPHMAIKDMYLLARSKDPEKVQELAKAAKDGEKDNSKDDKSKDGGKGDKQPKFGGLKSGGRDGSSSKSDTKSKNVKEELNKQFDEIFGPDGAGLNSDAA